MIWSAVTVTPAFSAPAICCGDPKVNTQSEKLPLPPAVLVASSSSTLMPLCVASSAATTPDTPAPTMTRSVSTVSVTLSAQSEA